MEERPHKVFSLSEIIVYVTIFIIILGMIGTVLVVVFRFSNESVLSTEISLELNKLLDTVQDLVDGSKSVECVNIDCVSSVGSTLKLRFEDTIKDPTCVFLENGTVKIAEGPNFDGGTSCSDFVRDITPEGITVHSLTFTMIQDENGQASVKTDASLAYNVRDKRIDLILIVGLFIVGSFLIKSILNETRQKRMLADLNWKLDKANEDLKGWNDNLQAKVAEQTVEIRQAYEVEKKAREDLEELDRVKDQFILGTQHHLRTPLTIIRGYLGVLEDDKSISQESKNALEKVAQSTETLSKFVNELIQVTELRTKGKEDKNV